MNKEKANNTLIFGRKKKTNWFKNIIGLLVFLSLSIGLVSVYVNSRVEYEISDYKLVTVKSGDTLWSLANVDSRLDTRKIIDDIQRVNGITANIQPGKIIKIPIYKEVR